MITKVEMGKSLCNKLQWAVQRLYLISSAFFFTFASLLITEQIDLKDLQRLISSILSTLRTSDIKTCLFLPQFIILTKTLDLEVDDFFGVAV